MNAYIPVTPPKRQRRREALWQLRHLPKTLLAVRRIIAADYQVPVLDEHLWSFRGFHEDADNPRYRARPWQKVWLGAVTADDVVGLAVWEMAFMLNVAHELEEPILEYSHQNGEGFRLLLPSLARFLGKNRDEVAYAARHNLPWCESPWCAEERRHATTFARIIERLTDTSPGRDNPNSPNVVTATEADAVKLVISRQAAEWNSSSTYVVLTAHATGKLHDLLRNVARDEVKHLAFETEQATVIERMVASEFGGFRGAETPGSRQDRILRRRIPTRGHRLVSASLLDRLREYQVSKHGDGGAR